MDNIGSRIKAARKALGLTQADFGNKLGLKPNTITSYETGNRTPADAIIISICKEYKVSREWLKTGNGEMFVPATSREEIANFASQIINDENAKFKRRLVLALSQLSDDQWDAIEAVVDKIIEQED